jgi:hypothetical protein
MNGPVTAIRYGRDSPSDQNGRRVFAYRNDAPPALGFCEKLVAPFRVFGQESPPRIRYRLAGVLSESAARSEFHLAKYRAYRFHDPAVPLAISSAVRFSFAGPR